MVSVVSFCYASSRSYLWLLLLFPTHLAWTLIISLLSHKVFNNTAWYSDKFSIAPILLLLLPHLPLLHFNPLIFLIHLLYLVL